MRALLLLAGFTLLLACAEKDSVAELNGAYLRKEFKYGDMKEWDTDQNLKVVKIFRDGYWMAFFYDDTRPERTLFDGAGGGTYVIQNGKYVEKIGFYSWDSTAIDTEVSLDYKVEEAGFQQYGKMNSEKYPDYAVNEKFDKIKDSSTLENPGLEGVWEMTQGTWGGENSFGKGKYKDATVRMIFQYPKMAVVYFDQKNKTFDGAGIFTYQFDGKNFTEVCEGYSWDSTHVGSTGKFLIQTDGETFTKTSESWPGFKEVFKRVK